MTSGVSPRLWSPQPDTSPEREGIRYPLPIQVKVWNGSKCSTYRTYNVFLGIWIVRIESWIPKLVILV